MAPGSSLRAPSRTGREQQIITWGRHGGRWQVAGALCLNGGGGGMPHSSADGSNISMREGLVAFLLVKLYARSSNNSRE